MVPPHLAEKVDKSRIFQRSARYVHTDKNGGEGLLSAKSRMIPPGDCDPDGDKPIEEGGFRTDAPTCAQISFHCFCSNSVRRKWRIRSFDVSTAFLTGDRQTRKLYCRSPTRGLPGVHPDSLLEINTGVYGLREAPRLWYQAADRKLCACGWEELKTARPTYICRDPHTGQTVGMLLLYVDDACYGGSGPHYEHVVEQTLKSFNVGKKFES